MPEFILDTKGAVPVEYDNPPRGAVIEWWGLDAFTQGYIQALFFTECSPAYDREEWFEPECVEAQEQGRADGNLPGDVGFDDLSSEALKLILSDCERFQDTHATLLQEAYTVRAGLASEYDSERAGMDFWYTRNGHGVGFWDRGLGEVGDKISELCGWRTMFATVDVYFGDDGKVHLS